MADIRNDNGMLAASCIRGYRVGAVFSRDFHSRRGGIAIFEASARESASTTDTEMDYLPPIIRENHAWGV